MLRIKSTARPRVKKKNIYQCPFPCCSTTVQVCDYFFFCFKVSKSEELSSDSPPCRAKSASTSGASLILDDSQSSSDILVSDDLSEV